MFAKGVKKKDDGLLIPFFRFEILDGRNTATQCEPGWVLGSVFTMKMDGLKYWSDTRGNSFEAHTAIILKL